MYRSTLLSSRPIVRTLILALIVLVWTTVVMAQQADSVKYPFLNADANRTDMVTNADLWLIKATLIANTCPGYQSVYARWGDSSDECLTIFVTLRHSWDPDTPDDSISIISDLVFRDARGVERRTPSAIGSAQARQILIRLLQSNQSLFLFSVEEVLDYFKYAAIYGCDVSNARVLLGVDWDSGSGESRHHFFPISSSWYGHKMTYTIYDDTLVTLDAPIDLPDFK